MFWILGCLVAYWANAQGYDVRIVRVSLAQEEPEPRRVRVAEDIVVVDYPVKVEGHRSELNIVEMSRGKRAVQLIATITP